jgi:hypothetical protein
MAVSGGNRPWPGLAAGLLLLSLALFIVSIASSRWLENQATGRQMYVGPFEACARDYKANLDECRRFDDGCNADFNAPIGLTSMGNCDELRTTRAFLILGLCFAAFGFLWSWLAYHAFHNDLMYRAPAILASLLSMLFGLIGWAVWVAMARRDFTGDWNYGWATGLGLGAWLLPLGAAIANMMPSPARDLKEGEILAHDTTRGRRGSWYDLFTRDYWTRGGDWGGHEAPLAGGTGTGVTGRSGYDERRGAPAGVGYRESSALTGTGARDDPARREYGYGESRESRDRPGFMEKMFGRSGDTEHERREREREQWHMERGHASGVGSRPSGPGMERGYESKPYTATSERGVGPLKTETAPSSTTGYGTGTGYHAPSEPQTIGSTTTSTAVSREPSAVDEPIA